MTAPFVSLGGKESLEWVMQMPTGKRRKRCIVQKVDEGKKFFIKQAGHSWGRQ